MKKISVLLFAVLMVFAFTACDNTTKGPDEPVYLSTGTMGDVEFENGSVTLTTENHKDYVVEGSLATMTEEQAKAFSGGGDGWKEGSHYISLNVSGVSEENKVEKQGWVSAIDSTDYLDEKTGSVKTGKILAITNGGTVRSELEDHYIWKIVLEDGKEYTVDFTKQFNALSNQGE